MNSILRFGFILAAFGVGSAAGLFLPALVAQLIGYGTGSYEDVLFVWLVSVPGGAVLSSWIAWRISSAKTAGTVKSDK